MLDPYLPPSCYYNSRPTFLSISSSSSGSVLVARKTSRRLRSTPVRGLWSHSRRGCCMLAGLLSMILFGATRFTRDSAHNPAHPRLLGRIFQFDVRLSQGHCGIQ